MKDAYSFDRTPEDLEEAYRLQYEAYVRTFTPRLQNRSDGLLHGGSNPHGISCSSNVGESEIAYCEVRHGGYYRES